jgi:hypothetical protein
MEHALREETDSAKSVEKYMAEREKTRALKLKLRDLLTDPALQQNADSD